MDNQIYRASKKRIKFFIACVAGMAFIPLVLIGSALLAMMREETLTDWLQILAFLALWETICFLAIRWCTGSIQNKRVELGEHFTYYNWCGEPTTREYQDILRTEVRRYKGYPRMTLFCKGGLDIELASEFDNLSELQSDLDSRIWRSK